MDEAIDISPIIKVKQRNSIGPIHKEPNSKKAGEGDNWKPRELYKVSESDIDYLNNLIGKNAVEFIQEVAGNDHIFFYTLGGGEKDRRYSAVNNGKVLVIHPFNDGTRTISLSFRTIETFNETLKSEKSIINNEVSQQLEKGSLAFLRFGGEFLKKIDTNTTVFLSPTSTRRERLYRRYVEKNNLTNIVIIKSQDDDIKGQK